MLGWMHLELNFKNHSNLVRDFSKEAFPQKKPEGSYKELITYLKTVVDSLSDLINRYFFLFEPNPHLFLALEAKDTNDFESIKDKISKIKMPVFIDSHDIKFNTGDENHAEGALDFFCASTKYAFFRVTDNYKTGYNNNDETKIIHCFCNQLFTSPFNELFFCLKVANNRGLLEWDNIIKSLRASGFPYDIPEFLFWDIAKINFFYNDQRVYIFENESKFHYAIVCFSKEKDNIVQNLIGAYGPFVTQKEAEDKAKELIDNNLKSSTWTRKPVT
jgi:hypothetical protein